MAQIQHSPDAKKPEEKILYIEWLKYKRYAKLSGVDVTDVSNAELLTINSAKEFSEKYGVSQSMLSRWRHSPEVQSYLRTATNNALADENGDSIKQKFIEYIKEKPSAANMMVWMKVFEGYREGQDIQHNVTSGAQQEEEEPEWILTTIPEETKE